MLRIIKNSAMLFIAQLGGYLIPLIELPFLARVLNPDKLGLVLKCQAVALTLALFVEYGFGFSASRTLATLGTGEKGGPRLMGIVLQAKTLLAALVLLPLAALYVAWPALQNDFPPVYAFLIALSCLAFGYSPMWYFQAKERFAFAVSCEVATRFIYLACLLLLIRSESDAPKVMALQVGFSLLNTGVTSAFAIKASGIIWSRWRAAWCELRQGWHLFVFKGATQILASSAPWVLGSVASTAAVGFYCGAEKITRAITGLTQPVMLASYPKFSQFFATDHGSGWRWLRVYMILASVVIVPLMGVLYYFSPEIVRLYLGSRFAPAASILRVLTLLVFVRVAVVLLGTLCLLPAKQDKAVSQATLLSGAIALFCGGVLGYRFGGLGMAWAILLAETVRLGLYVVSVRKLRPLKMVTLPETDLSATLSGREPLS